MTLRRSFDLLLLAIAFAACSAPQRTETPARVDPRTTAIAHATTIPDVYETTGTVRARTTSQLAAKVVGNVTQVLVSEGDVVRRGQLLLQIDSREADSMLTGARAGFDEIDHAIESATAAEAAATANAKLAESTYQRYLVLRDRGSVSAHEFDGIEAQQKAAAADLQRATAARQQLSARKNVARASVATAATFAGYDEIRSPIDGVVIAKNVDVGSQAAPGMVLMTIEDTSRLRVDAFVPENIASQLHASDSADVDDGRARIAQIVPAVDPITRTALVMLDLEPTLSSRAKSRDLGGSVAQRSPTLPDPSTPLGMTKEPPLRSGQAVRVRLPIGSRRALAVPSAAIRIRGQLRQLEVVDADGVAQTRLITTGRTFAGSTEVLSGLDEGERYVAGGTP